MAENTYGREEILPGYFIKITFSFGTVELVLNWIKSPLTPC